MYRNFVRVIGSVNSIIGIYTSEDMTGNILEPD